MRLASRHRRLHLGAAVAVLVMGGSTFVAVPSGASSKSAPVAAASKALHPYLKAPTKLPLRKALKSRPPKGKTMIYIECTSSQCKAVNTGVAAASKSLGWHFKSLNFQVTNPSTLTAALQQALLYKPVAVAFNAMPEAEWATEIPAYKAAGVPIIAAETGPTPIKGPVIAAIGDDGAVQGKILADWFVSRSGGKGSALFVNVPAFAIFKATAISFAKTTKSECSKCTITYLNATVAQQGDNAITPLVISTLQKDPNIKYVVATDGVMIPGLPEALTSAGITGVKIATGDATITNEQDVMRGSETAAVPTNFEYLGWLAVDATVRHLEKMNFSGSDGGMPEELLTKANTRTATESANIPVRFQTDFKHLWHVGKVGKR